MKDCKISLLVIATSITALTLSWGSEIDRELVSESYGGNIERVQRLIRQGANLEAVAFETWTPLAAAADQGHLIVVRELIAAGANVNALDGGGNTPLFYAAIKGRTEVAKFLLKNGGRINDWPRTKQYVLETVKKNGNPELIQLIKSLH
jgi:ankyrin repeat protein